MIRVTLDAEDKGGGHVSTGARHLTPPSRQQMFSLTLTAGFMSWREEWDSVGFGSTDESWMTEGQTEELHDCRTFREVFWLSA